jgi:gamma-glutamylcyclotransferase
VETFNYFAYGSNMLTERLKQRCSRAEALGLAQVQNYDLSFSKVSKDGSGKATLVKANDGVVYGVLFRIPKSERPALDEAEGPGYQRDDKFAVVRSDGSKIIASAYLAEPAAANKNLRPYVWYRELIITGAKQHGLPEHYQESLNGFAAESDPTPTRKTRQQALALLNRLWETSLSESDSKVLGVARRLYTALPADGACYRASFFLAYHLKQRFGIEGIARVGFVNDGTDDLFSSHAWYELDGKITDLGISRPLNPDHIGARATTWLGLDLSRGAQCRRAACHPPIDGGPTNSPTDCGSRRFAPLDGRDRKI